MSRLHQIGRLGETVVEKLLMGSGLAEGPFYPAAQFGDRFPILDYFLVSLNDPTAYAFIQVKTTTRYVNAEAQTARISFDASKMQCFAQMPAPTYLVVVVLEDESAFIQKFGLSSSISRTINCSVMQRLTVNLLADIERDILSFWQQNPTNKQTWH